MTSPYDTYTSPLASRNASEAMLRLWSPRHKFNTWRRIWLAVAEAMHEVTKGGGTGTGDAETGGTGVSPVRASGSPGTGGTPVPPGSGQSARELVTIEQVEELRAVVERRNPDGTIGITDDEIRLAEKYERELRHDVMAHVHALGDACPKARPIIHLGMTSQDVVCNADLITIGYSLDLILLKMHRTLFSLCASAQAWSSLPTLGFTHYQPAQPVTVGRRLAGWASELLLLAEDRDHKQPRFRGLRGATGTQASFLSLLNGEPDAIDDLEARVVARLHRLRLKPDPQPDKKPSKWDSYDFQASNKIWYERNEETSRLAMAAGGFSEEQIEEELKQHKQDQNAAGARKSLARSSTFPLTGQTYPRWYDCSQLSFLASVAAVLHKIATDIRLLCNRKELDEPFEDKQIGSSAMPYKRNPMRCERICGLTRFVMNLVGNAYDTAATQWLERTLDDSSNRRLSLPEAFLALDGALDLMHNVASGLIVHEAMVRRNLMAELPFLATENILMECVKRGGDRQDYHERIRQHAQAAGWRVKHEGLDNDLLERLKNDKAFWSKARGGPLTAEIDWDDLMDPMKYIGRSVEQTERFIKDVVEPLREQYGEAIAKLDESGPRV